MIISGLQVIKKKAGLVLCIDIH